MKPAHTNCFRQNLLALAALASVAALSLGACTNVPDNEKQAADEQAADRPISNAVGKATPVASPASGEIDGEKLPLPEHFPNVTDVETAGDVLAIRGGHLLLIGTSEQIRRGEAKELTINEKCGDVTSTPTQFILACPVPLEGNGGSGVIYEIDADSPKLVHSRTASMKFTSAAKTTSGEIVAGSAEENDVYVFRGTDSSQAKKIATGRKAHQIVAAPAKGREDGVVFIDRDATVIQGIDVPNNRPGGALRMGVGVGSIAPGEDGLVFAADTMGDQFGLYTDTDVLRLHQTHPTDPAPWALVADRSHDAVWVSSNADNTIQAFTYSTGVPVPHGKLKTIDNVRSVAMTGQGDLVLASDSGTGVQIISAADVRRGVEKQI